MTSRPFHSPSIESFLPDDRGQTHLEDQIKGVAFPPKPVVSNDLKAWAKGLG